MADDGGKGSSRREMIVNVILVGVMGIAGALVMLPFVGVLLNPVVGRPKKGVWRNVGAVDTFAVGKTYKVQYQNPRPLPWAGVGSLTAAWLRRDAVDRFTAFSINCAHLGCPLRWIEESQLFMCPCHGGVYYSNGKHAAGPPPRGMFEYPVRIRSGWVEIQTSALPMV